MAAEDTSYPELENLRDPWGAYNFQRGMHYEGYNYVKKNPPLNTRWGCIKKECRAVLRKGEDGYKLSVPHSCLMSEHRSARKRFLKDISKKDNSKNDILKLSVNRVPKNTPIKMVFLCFPQVISGNVIFLQNE